MARYRPPRFSDFERRPDEYDQPVRRGPGGGRRIAPPPPPLAQRDYKTIARPRPVELTNVAFAKDRMRANGPLVAVHKGKLDASRGSQAISAATAFRKTQVAVGSAKRSAKPSGADRRMFNPTSGPKTFYGTFARIEPKSGGRFRFVLPAHVVPCVQRATRREVLFAKGHGGKGSHSKKRFNSTSHIGC